ncbi:tRNA modification GTPase, putative [Plasmodium vivax]|uniref:tRNA modification GTPase, putative n=1 Tax=Plasmodium vivax TaxID=5855 RepID=A0A564ZR24_PLAVI|nr:tRNA modification GTPase, putative [Plasmodium vivax]
MYVTFSKLIGFIVVTHLVSPCTSLKRSTRRGKAPLCFIPRSGSFCQRNALRRGRSCGSSKGGGFAVSNFNTADTATTANAANAATAATAATALPSPRGEYLARVLGEGDTIYALSSGGGVSAIAVVRMSGPLSRVVLEVLLHGGVSGEASSERGGETGSHKGSGAKSNRGGEAKRKRDNQPNGEPPPDGRAMKRKTEYTLEEVMQLRRDLEERKMCSGGIYNNCHEQIDQVVYSFFKSPKSYTGEDVVEIYCHGSPLIVNEIMEEIEKLNSLFANILKSEKEKYFLSQIGKNDNFTCTCSEEIWNKLVNTRNDAFFSKIRPSRRGEFTRRAFQNGKMNLLQVEGLKELLWCSKKEQKKIALNYLNGKAKKIYATLRNDMKKLLLYTQVKIDLEDEHLSSDEERSSINRFIQRHLSNAIGSIRKILRQPNVEDLSTPLDVLLFGQVNSGKSTLMNRICRSDVSIVTRIQGSTIDVVQKGVTVEGRPYNFCDSAGVSARVLREEQLLRRDDSKGGSPTGESNPHRALERMGVKKPLKHLPHRALERMGVRKTLKHLLKSACVLIVLNVRKYADELKLALSILSSQLGERESSGGEKTTPLPQLIICVNKCDLAIRESRTEVRRNIKEILKRKLKTHRLRRIHRNVWRTIFFVSSKEGRNVGALLRGLNEAMRCGAVSGGKSGAVNGVGGGDRPPAFLPFERHKTHLRRALKHLLFIKRHRHLLTFDIIAEELRLAVAALNAIIGGFSQARILNEILETFCVGK